MHRKLNARERACEAWEQIGAVVGSGMSVLITADFSSLKCAEIRLDGDTFLIKVNKYSSLDNVLADIVYWFESWADKRRMGRRLLASYEARGKAKRND